MGEFETESEDEASSSSTARSVLDVLDQPTRSDRARKRRITTNPPPKGKKRRMGRTAADPKSVTPNQSVREYYN